MKSTLRLFCSVVVFLFVRQFAFAQGAATGDLHVSVKDPKGSVVTNATVTGERCAKGLERAGSSDGQGGYSVRQIAPGFYTVTVDAPGFARAEAPEVAITVGEVAELPVEVTVAGGKEVVEVTRASRARRNFAQFHHGHHRPAPHRQSVRSTAATTSISRSPIRRSSATTPPTPEPRLRPASTSAVNARRSNLVNVDGADATDNSVNGVRSTVSQEAVQEFQIITNSYAAEYGRASGGVVNIITRSGSNDFHGDVYGYLRNRDFQAVNPFSTTPNPLTRGCRPEWLSAARSRKTRHTITSPMKLRDATRLGSRVSARHN